MIEASNPGNDGTLAAYIEKTKQINDLVLKLLQKINGDNEVSQEEGRGEHPSNHGKKEGSSPPCVETRSDANHDEFVTNEELMGFLSDKTPAGITNGTIFQPPYPREIH